MANGAVTPRPKLEISDSTYVLHMHYTNELTLVQCLNESTLMHAYIVYMFQHIYVSSNIKKYFILINLDRASQA